MLPKGYGILPVRVRNAAKRVRNAANRVRNAARKNWQRSVPLLAAFRTPFLGLDRAVDPNFEETGRLGGVWEGFQCVGVLESLETVWKFADSLGMFGSVLESFLVVRRFSESFGGRCIDAHHATPPNDGPAYRTIEPGTSWAKNNNFVHHLVRPDSVR